MARHSEWAMMNERLALLYRSDLCRSGQVCDAQNKSKACSVQASARSPETYLFRVGHGIAGHRQLGEAWM